MEHGQSGVSILPISQATTATFTDLYFRLTFLFFVQAGSKRVLSPPQGELIGEEGDLLIFPAGSMVTMENRPVMDRDYRAVGVSFSDDLIDTVFADQRPTASAGGIQIVRARPSRPMQILPMIRETLKSPGLPEPILRHRLLEPLVWLRHHGYLLRSQAEESPLTKVRGLIETDLTRSWRASDVADHLAMSEATLRRRLSTAGQGFAKILLHTRLEHGLSQLQSTDIPISEIAMNCGFGTPSHFSDAFKKRFGIRPKEIRTAEG
ncbi:MAG: helix-turn-helix transcriptional regulator [Pseudomonadota bacterium]